MGFFLPSTGIVNAASAESLTAAMPGAVMLVLESEKLLSDGDQLKSTYSRLNEIREQLKGLDLSKLKTKEGATSIVEDMIFKATKSS